MSFLLKAITAAREGRLTSAARNRCNQYQRQRTDNAMRRKLGLPRASEVSLHGDFNGSSQAAALLTAFELARTTASPLPDEVRDIEGMSGQRYRAFINHLLGKLPTPRYLEIGSWKGSTLCAAMHGNGATAVCIDNWSQFNGPRDAFFENIAPIQDRVQVIEQDFRTVDYPALGAFDAYLFDGPHLEDDHFDAVVIAQAAMSGAHPTFIVDDWNLIPVRMGTMRGLSAAGFAIDAAIEVRTTLDNTNAAVAGKISDWHNGYMLAVLKAQASD